MSLRFRKDRPRNRRSRSRKRKRKHGGQELDYGFKELAQKNELELDKLNEMLDETEELMEELPFDEASFMARDLRENPEREYDFDGHRKQLEVYRKRVEEGIEILQEEKQCRERYDQRLAEVDRRRRNGTGLSGNGFRQSSFWSRREVN